MQVPEKKVTEDDERIILSRVMREASSSFLKHLGMALSQSDWSNAKKIKDNWKKEWDICLKVGEELDVLNKLVSPTEIINKLSFP